MTPNHSPSSRPVFISVMQYEDRLKSGATTVFDVIDAAHRLGADGVELRRETWPNWQQELTAARARIEELGLRVTYATHITLFSSQPDGQQTLYQDIDAAAALGSPILRVFQGPAPESDDAPEWQAAQAAVDHAAFQGVVIALENYVGMPGGKLAEIQRVLAQISAPALGTNIDIGNYAQHNQDVPEAIRAVGARAVYVHLKDKSGTEGEPPIPLGDGVLPLPDILHELEQLPQQLLYCFEFRGGEEPEVGIEKSMAYLQGV